MAFGTYSFQTGEKTRFVTADYVTCGCTIAVIAVIWVFFDAKNRNRNTSDQNQLESRNMHPFPVAMSLLSSFIHVVMFLGNPTEVYINGIMFMFVTIGLLIAGFAASHLFVPVFCNLGITDVLQYIEMRFGKVSYGIALNLYVPLMYFTNALVLYASSLALNAVTDLHIWACVIVIGSVCILYTITTGMKSVVWVESLHILIMFAGMLTILIIGSSTQGGFRNVWNIAQTNGRTLMHSFETDPRLRHSTWSLVIGGGVLWCSIIGTHRTQVKKALAAKTDGRIKLAIWLSLGGLAFTIIVNSLVGIVMFSFYSTCDPVEFGLVPKADQLLSLFMVDLLSDKAGLSGLIHTAVFSGSLSSISSGLSTLACLSLESIQKIRCCKEFSSSRSEMISKSFVVLHGLFVIGCAFLAEAIGSLILPMALSMYGLLWGPIFGLFILGMFFPWANKWGGNVGLIASVVLMNWFGLGTTLTKASIAQKLLLNTDGCNWNITNRIPPIQEPQIITDVTTSSIFDKYEGLENLYSVSYLWYTAISTLTVVLVGLITSFLTGPTDPRTLNPKLIVPVFDICLPCLPVELRKKLRFGVKHFEDLNTPHVHEPQLEPTTNNDNRNDSVHLSSISRGHNNAGYDVRFDTRL